MVGLFLIILAQVSFAIGGIIIRKYLEGYNSYVVTSFMLLTSALVFAPMLFYFKSQLMAIPSKGIWFMLLASLFWIVIAEILYIKGFQQAPSITLASLMTLFYPLFSTILGILILHERLTIKTIIAGILMVSGFVFLLI